MLENSADSKDRAARAKLLENCANFQNGRGQYVAAEKKLLELLEIQTESTGAESSETLKALDQLAWTLRS